MPMTSFVTPVLLSLALAVAACERDEPAPAPSPAKAAAPPPSPSPPPALPLGATPASDESEASSPTGGDRIVAAGEWTENKQYKFRLERIEACGPITPDVGPPRPENRGGAGAPRGATSWVGAYFSVRAKDKSVFVSPRDLELRRGGVILTAKHINQPLLQGCQPLLPATRLRGGEAVAGFALFEVPASLRKTTEDPLVLSYRPTRWGGARTVEVPIPECFDACSKSLANRAAATAGRNPPASRRKN
jgi:hypothetical protein